jgi:phosphatidylglycerophosphate synthase
VSFRQRLLATGIIASAATAIIALLARLVLPVSSNFALSSGLLMLALTIAAIALGEEHPFARFGPANHITVVRAAIVAMLAALVFEARAPVLAAIAVTCIAGSAVLDGVDGWLARRTRMISAFGARVDMETDALLIMVVSLLVWRYDKAGVWVLAGGLLRYAFVAAGMMLPWMAAPLTPTLRAKTITIVHVVGLCVALAPIIPWPLSAIAAAVTTALLAWSFAVDVGRLWRQRAQ